METLLFLLGPGSLIACALMAVAEFYLSNSFDLKYYQMGPAKKFTVDLDLLEKISENSKNKDQDPHLYKISAGLFYIRMLLNKDQAQLKLPYFLWIPYLFIFFTALLNYKLGNVNEIPMFIAGTLFVFGGLHINLHLKAQQFKKRFERK